MVKYIHLITKIRKKAANYFEKDFYELLNKAVIYYYYCNLGKTMELTRKIIKMELVSSEQKLQKLTNRITLKYCTFMKIKI
jgi:hypothetical protein